MIRYGIYHMFVSGLFCKPNPLFLFYLWYSSCFEVKCWFHTFPKWCSHIAMCILILLDHRGHHVNSFPTGVLLFKWIWSFQHSRDQFSVLCNGVYSICPKLPLFSRPPTLFLQGLRFLNQVSIYSCEVYSLFSINVLIRWFSGRCSGSFKFIILHSRILFRWIQLKLSVLIIALSSLQMLSHAGAPHFHSSSRYSIVPECSRYLEDSCFHSAFIQALSRMLSLLNHLIQLVQSLF